MSPCRTFVFDRRPGETRCAALTADQSPFAFDLERSSQTSQVGGVYLGRVRAVRPELKAAFIDIGGDIDAFLNVGQGVDAGGRKIVQGTAVLVQVDRDGYGAKGPRLSVRIELSGRNVVLVGGGEGVRVSRKIADNDWVAAAERALTPLCTEGIGFTVRSRAQTTPIADVVAEAMRLRARWDALCADATHVEKSVPRQILPPPPLPQRFLSQWLGSERVKAISNDAAILNMLSEWDRRAGVEVVSGSAFAHMGLADSFDAQFDPVVTLIGGGRLMIEETAALVAVDVDAASRNDTVLATNIAAAEVVAAALRLRNLGGLIVVDFLKMSAAADKSKLMAALNKALELDPLKPRAAGVSAMGLVEIERRRFGASLNALCLHRSLEETPETRALAALHAVEQAGGTRLLLEIAPDVAAALDDVCASPKAEVARRLGIDIALRVVSDAPLVGYRLIKQ